ncbi:dead end protein 1-like [Stigmatopora nigra]
MERRALHQEMFELCTANAQVPIKNPLDTLEKWLQKTNIRLTQVNGQRKYGGPPSVWHGPAPGSNCEVFIGRIPRDMYEDKLIPLFSSVGPLWEFRLMMNFSGHNRGFAYAKYGSAEIAQAAIHQLHGHMLEPGVRIVVYPSTEKRQLWITELPMIVQEDQFLKVLRRMTEGVERLYLTGPNQRETLLAIVDFTSHYAASMAKRVLGEAFRKQYGFNISVNWDPQMKAHKRLSRLYKSQRSGPQQPLQLPRLARVKISGATGPNPQPCADASAFSNLENVCAATGIGAPLFEFNFSHSCCEGYLNFTYRVRIPDVGAVLPGLLVIWPGATEEATLEIARERAAEHVLRYLKTF